MTTTLTKTTTKSTDVQDHMTQSMNAIVMLNASCQAIVENYIAPSNSPWYKQVFAELGEAQDLVRQWRLSGNLYFGQTIVQGTIDCGTTFLASKTQIEALYTKLSQNFSETDKQTLIAELKAVEPKIKSLNTNIASYEESLRSWNIQLEGVHKKLANTIAEIQAQEGDLQADITATNQQIDLMQQTIEKDRKAIAKAKSQRTSGIVETIFGVLLAPVTGGASLILAGIGVGSIVEAEAKVKALESDIKSDTNRIVTDQAHLSDDKKQIVSLKGISSSAELVLSDVEFIEESLDSLRTDWALLEQELGDEISKIEKATTAEEVILSKVWFESACLLWQSVLDYAKSLENLPTNTTKVSVS